MFRRSLIYALVTLSLNSFAQVNVRGTYCQGCCGCINYHFLSIFDSTFSVFYTYKKETYSGHGKYTIDGSFLLLEFKDANRTNIVDKLQSREDSVEIRFAVVKMVLVTDTVEVATIQLRRTSKEEEKLAYLKNQIIKLPFRRAITFRVSYPGFHHADIAINGPGKYQATIFLRRKSDHTHRGGTRKKLKIKAENGGPKLVDTDHPRVVFSNRNCGCK